MGFYTLSHGRFHDDDRGYSDILYGINSIDIMEHSVTQSHGNYLVLLPYWVVHTFFYTTSICGAPKAQSAT